MADTSRLQVQRAKSRIAVENNHADLDLHDLLSEVLIQQKFQQ